MSDPNNGDPNALLNEISSEKKSSRKGKLKIFFGSSAGVGKTYAMLSAAREQMEKGLDVLAGIVETHGRPETENLLEGIRIMQPLEISYRGLSLKEFDLDTTLTRHPDIVLVDELAHTNAQGCRHPKRWNDVMELIDAGIDVYTTLNVQHIESLSDLVSTSTGVVIKETVPDMIFDIADDVVLVDLDEDDLIRRLHDGKVYVAPGAMARAAENFFKKSNLSALRELALRRTADRVDAERLSLTQTAGTVALSEKLLVAIALNSSSAKLLRSCKRMANALKASWTAVFVDNSLTARLPDEKARYLESLERMVDRMGGETVTLRGQDIAQEIMGFATRNGFTKIIVGKSVQPSFKHFIKGFLADRIIRLSGVVDVYVITDEMAPKENYSTTFSLGSFRSFNYILSFLTALAFTIPGFMLSGTLAATDQALLYFAGVILVAERFGFGPSIFFSVLASTFFNFFFLQPIYELSLQDSSYLTTALIMLAAGVFVSTQISRLNVQALNSRDKESRMREFFMLTKNLAATRGRFPVSEVVANFLSKFYAVDASVWMSNSDGHPSVILGNLPEETYYKDFGALQWCFENGHNAGMGTATMPRAAGFYLPLSTSDAAFGVLGLFPKSSTRTFTKNEVSSFETVASLLSSALERVRSAEVAEQIMIEREPEQKIVKEEKKPEKLMDADLLRPFNAIHITQATDKLTTPQVTSANTIQNLKASQSLLKFFELERTRIWGSKLNRRPASLVDRVNNIIERLLAIDPNTKLDLKLPPDLPDVLIDCLLTEQMLIDFITFSIKRSPPFSTIAIGAKREGSNVLVKIQDKGPSLSAPQIDCLLNRFPDHNELEGNGLPKEISLSVPASMVRLHGGQVSGRNRPISGVEISFTLPIA